MGPAEDSRAAKKPQPFFGVYLLYCLNPKYRGRVYVGFTVNPSRRVQQHNAGRKKGGAWRTSGRGPWEMVLIVHGFPSDVAALRVAPWNRLPLTVRWLQHDFQQELSPPPPQHMPLAFGPLQPGLTQGGRRGVGKEADDVFCSLCQQPVQDKDGPLCCPHPNCPLNAHLICLAEEFLQEEPQQLLPLKGCCPGCKNTLLWGDLIRLHQAYPSNLEEVESDLEEVGSVFCGPDQFSLFSHPRPNSDSLVYLHRHTGRTK
ncbi:structure-specific endonuclease subunit SLX1 isoform X4 [Trichosurus vulpecula]|uniref:structure-specific endonuclease subunit SLX1 isoform X4 n=1 Tax=Trichosurus vulpecula TaxID=9337 RepID=UPI00186AC68A|nr:structure-specific endonuclease subunit SLX1 isoform X4 [Trichosurus vulpecula]